MIIALICAIGALIYGVQSIKWILAKRPPAIARMQEIAAAVQEGAQRLPEPAVHHHRHRRRGAVRRSSRVVAAAGLAGRAVGFVDRRRAVRAPPATSA
ncbi:MAG: hypothetical protein MZW92_72310 [Comamonadaceae bacterium]|nr:hypothetical protein [Comamonadaceae bacterium]